MCSATLCSRSALNQSYSATWSTFGSQHINNNWAWRLPSILQGVVPVLQVFLIFFVPESPRWLVSKGREAQALKTLAYYHADGNEQDPLVQFEFNEIKSAIEFDRDGELIVVRLCALDA